jgi:hypothetical protein
MARGRQGRSAEITLMHHPPMVMTDVQAVADEPVKITDGSEAANGARAGGAAAPKGIAAKGEP